jgi:hypothetical protein
MTITSATQVLEDGPRNFVVRLSASLQAGDAEILTEKVGVAALSQWQYRECTSLSLLQLQASTVNASFNLIWEAADQTDNQVLWRFPMNFANKQNFRKFGGIQNNAIGKTGNVLLITENWGDPQLDGGYEIVLWFRKKYTNTNVSNSVNYGPNFVTLNDQRITLLGDTVTL